MISTKVEVVCDGCGKAAVVKPGEFETEMVLPEGAQLEIQWWDSEKRQWQNYSLDLCAACTGQIPGIQIPTHAVNCPWRVTSLPCTCHVRHYMVTPVKVSL